MASVTFKGTPVSLKGTFPQVGEQAPVLSLVKNDLSTITLDELSGKKIVLNIFPSVDTSVCALQLKNFNQKVAGLENTVLLSASLDLPFALGRFCGAEGIADAITGSDFRSHSLAENYGVEMTDGPLAGLYARAVLILDEPHKVIYTELVSEITEEPDYDKAIAAIKI